MTKYRFVVEYKDESIRVFKFDDMKSAIKAHQNFREKGDVLFVHPVRCYEE